MRSRRRLSSSSLALLAGVVLLVGAAYAVAPSLSPLLPSHITDDIQENKGAGCDREAVNGEHASAVQDSKAFPTSFSRKDLSVNSLEAGEATFLPTNTHPPESTTVQAQSGSTTHRNSGVSMMAIFSRYFDEIKWLTDPNAGVMDNSTGKPRFIMPIKIYQPADIGQDGLPIFPGYFPPAPLNLTTEEAEATGKNYSNHAYNDAYVARMGLGLGCEEERKQSTRPPGVCRGR